MDRRYRLLGIGVLVLALGGVCVGYGATDHWRYPTSEEVTAEPASHDGDRVMAFLVVASVEADGTMTARWGGHPLEVQGLDPAAVSELEPGALVQVAGTLRAGSTVIEADRLVVDFGTTRDLFYTYAVSILGGLLAATQFLRYWRPDWTHLRFEQRGGS